MGVKAWGGIWDDSMDCGEEGNLPSTFPWAICERKKAYANVRSSYGESICSVPINYMHCASYGSFNQLQERTLVRFSPNSLSKDPPEQPLLFQLEVNNASIFLLLEMLVLVMICLLLHCLCINRPCDVNTFVLWAIVVWSKLRKEQQQARRGVSYVTVQTFSKVTATLFPGPVPPTTIIYKGKFISYDKGGWRYWGGPQKNFRHPKGGLRKFVYFKPKRRGSPKQLNR